MSSAGFGASNDETINRSVDKTRLICDARQSTKELTRWEGATNGLVTAAKRAQHDPSSGVTDPRGGRLSVSATGIIAIAAAVLMTAGEIDPSMGSGVQPNDSQLAASTFAQVI